MRKVGFAVLVVGSLVALIALPGCGGSSSSSPSEAQLQAAKREGEEAAREKDRIDDLQKQVRSLRRQTKRAGSTVVVEPDSGSDVHASVHAGESTILRTFHAPSGNVSCQILLDGALCSVGSIATTFAFSGGQPAHVESGTALSQGAGELAPYGSTVSAGAIACTVPQSSESHGIICTDSASGHGFEASRVADRQHVY